MRRKEGDPSRMRIFFSVGEPSGDQHAAHLIRELKQRRSGIVACGYGGPAMEQAGCELHYPMTTLAVMGFLRVVPLLWKFYRLVKQAERHFQQSPPDAVVLVDFPGFNWWMARKAHAAGIPVSYYLPPQLWAWASWRIERVRKYVDHVLCTLPFEYQWYRDHGIAATYVGHPFFDDVASRPLDAEFLREWSAGPERNVAVLPGSRNHEIAHNWPVMLEILGRVHGRHPDARFLVACYKPAHRAVCQERAARDAPDLPLNFFVGQTSEIIELADCALMVSGSVSLEMLDRLTPACVLYHGSWADFVLARLLLNCHYMSLPNLMAEHELMPEYPCAGKARIEVGKAADRLNHWLADSQALAYANSQLRQLRDTVASTGATEQAAQQILSTLDKTCVARAA